MCPVKLDHLSSANTQAARKEPLGVVLCFASAKGGTGKTVLSATTAYTLLQAGMRVITIDTDFSTRGLSLYLLGSALDSTERNIQSKHCLADAILDEVPYKDVTPLKLVNGDVEYHVIISNKDVYHGGVPDEQFLGGGLNNETSTIPKQYFNYLQKLCERFRQEYDYVIIDTRGGYDFTSAAPAAVADGYIVVLEADMVSIEQVSAFKRKIDEFTSSIKQSSDSAVQATLKGFIVNKAIFSVDEAVFPEALARLYKSKTFGVIPADNDVIRSYQKKNIPQEKYPDSDFSFFSLSAIEQIVSPAVNWPWPENRKKFQQFYSSIKKACRGRQRVERVQARIPILLLGLAATSITFYLFFKWELFANALLHFYIFLAVFTFLAIASATLRSLALLQQAGVRRWRRYGVGVFSLLLIAGLLYLTTIDIPKTFSKDQLQKENREYKYTIADQRDELERLRKDIASANLVLAADNQQAQQAISERDAQITDLQNQITQNKVQLSSYRNNLSGVQSAKDNLQLQLDYCRQLK